MKSSLCRPISFTSHKVFVVRKSENAVLVCINKAKGLVEIKRYSNSIDREPLHVTLDFGLIIGNNDFPDLPLKPSASVDGFKPEQLIKHNIVRTSRLSHQEINSIRGHERIFELYPVIPFPCRHIISSLERQISVTVIQFGKSRLLISSTGS